MQLATRPLATGYNLPMEMNQIPTPDPAPAKIPTTRLERAFQRQKKNRETLLMALLPVVFLLGLGLGWIIWGTGSKTALQANAPAPSKRYEVSIDGNPTLGPADAPVTLVEFSDYECPFCIRWYQQVYLRLMKEYEGKIRFVYRDFPLTSIHPDAAPAALAANCAGEQQAYYRYHDALFSDKYNLGQEAYIQYAADLELNIDAFKTCLNENRYASEVESDMRYGYTIGVTSTPTFYINGIPVVGAQPYEVFQQIIDQELASKKQ
jgi:protein-disulfide isomerase